MRSSTALVDAAIDVRDLDFELMNGGALGQGSSSVFVSPSTPSYLLGGRRAGV